VCRYEHLANLCAATNTPLVCRYVVVGGGKPSEWSSTPCSLLPPPHTHNKRAPRAAPMPRTSTPTPTPRWWQVALKLFAYGFSRYWRNVVRRLDFVLTLLNVVTTVVYVSRQSESAGMLFRVTVAARSLRVVKMLSASRAGITITKTFFRILPALGNLWIILLR
jgi:hypothetical protein